MRACFVCETPFHLFTCVNMAQHFKGPKDLYVVNLFSEASEMVDRITKLRIFKNVFLIDDIPSHGRIKNVYYYRVRLYIITTFLYFVSGMYLKKKAPGICCLKYTHLFNCHRVDFFPRIVNVYFMRHNPRMKFNYYDDGIGSYYNYFLYKPTMIGRMMDGLFSKGNSLRIRPTLHIYNPLLYCDKNYQTYVKCLKRIAPLKNNERNTAIIKSIFSIDHCPMIKQKYIFMDTIRNEEFYNKGVGYYDRLSRVVRNMVGIDNLIYKFHPRDNEFDENLPHFNETNVPIECYCYFEDFSNKVLISNYSTAVFTPKIIYDQEPYIVFLHRIMKDYMTYKPTSEICDRLKELYRDKSRIIIPESVDELINALDRVSNS